MRYIPSHITFDLVYKTLIFGFFAEKAFLHENKKMLLLKFKTEDILAKR